MDRNSGRGGGASGGRRRSRSRSRSRSRGRGGGGLGDHHNRGDVGRGNNTSQSNQGGGRGWDAPHRGAHHQPPALQQWVSRPPVQGNQPPAQQARVYRPPQSPPIQHPRQQHVDLAGGSAGSCTGRLWGPFSSFSTSVLCVPPGTVVDEYIIHPQDLDFYHCSCYGALWKTLWFSFE